MPLQQAELQPQAPQRHCCTSRPRSPGRPFPFAALRGKSLTDMIVWGRGAGDAGLLGAFLAAGVIRPLGQCGRHPTAPNFVPGTRASQAVKGPKRPIACRRCSRCGNRPGVNYAGTPMDRCRNRSSLESWYVAICHWSSGSLTAAAFADA